MIDIDLKNIKITDLKKIEYSHGSVCKITSADLSLKQIGRLIDNNPAMLITIND